MRIYYVFVLGQVGAYGSTGDHGLIACADISAKLANFIFSSACGTLATMFRTWKRTFDAILWAGVAVSWAQRLPKVKSVRALGARFDCPGFNGRVLLPSGALTDLCAQFSFSPRLSPVRAGACI